MAVFLARAMLGLLFAVVGWHKVFVMGPTGHAEQLFLIPYAETWIPTWLLWVLGVTIPVLELCAGVLLLFGVLVRPTGTVLVGLLLIVLYGHLLVEPFFDLTTHVFPRAVLLMIVLAVPRSWDRFAVDQWRAGPE